MQNKNSKKKIEEFAHMTCAILCVLSFTHAAFAQVMSSPSYMIESDSVNAGGGLSSSTNYALESTAGEVGTGYSSSTSYNLHAGYQQMDTVFVALSAPANVTLAPAIPSVGGGAATGETQVTVTTDDALGYSLSIAAAGAPALTSGGDSFADYVPAGIAPDFAFAVASNGSAFGFSPEGADIVPLFEDDGIACNTGSSDTINSCWQGLSTSPQAIATRSSANIPLGTDTTLKFRAESGAANTQPAGNYSSTITLTAIAL